MIDGIETVIFDLDGTLYEDERIYDRYAEELARFLPEGDRSRYLAEWERAKRGQSVEKVGMGYDAERDLLFRYRRDRITSYLDWRGREMPALGAAGGADAGDPGPPIEAPAFGPGRFSIGDWWRLPDVLATHFGVPAEDRSRAFTAVRSFMASEQFQLSLEPGMRPLLTWLRQRGKRLVVMSNSPAASVDDVLGELGVRECFDLILTDAQKPIGIRRYLENVERPDGILSVGDVYVNEIEPVLTAGGAAVYIDRHGTNLGDEHERRVLVPSIASAIAWLRENL